MNDCGLSEKTILKIWSVFAQYAEVEKAILYGSRAKGNYKNGSDIDLTLEGKLTDSIRGKIAMDLDDLLLPYGIDLSIFAHINHAKFRDHIERVGVVFYDKSVDRKKVGWEVAKLGEVCLVRRGTTITKTQTINGDVPVVAGGTKSAYCHNQSNRNANVITVSGSGANAGFVNYWDMPIFASDCATIEPKDETQNRKFILYYLLSQQQYIYDNFRSGAAQPHVYAKDIATLSYPIIPINHQRKIVAKLDSAFAEIETAIVAARQKRIEIANLKSAALSACLSPNGDEWETVELKDISEIQSGLWKGKKEPFIKATVVRNTNFRANGYLNYDNVAILDVEEKQFRSRQLMFGDIILEKSGGGDNTPVGRVCLFERKGENYSLSNFTAYIRVKNKKRIFYRYLHYFLYSFYIKGKTESMQRYSTAIRNLQLTQYKSIVVLLPTLEQQQAIVAKLDAIFAELDKADAATKTNEQNYIALKKSMLAEVFGKTSDAI